MTFVNHYGITLAADMYVPKDAEGKLPAIAVSGPFGAVKEQCSGLYAQTMAERGFLTIAFDPSFTGESGGNVRYMASPDINTEDFMAAMDFLSLHEKSIRTASVSSAYAVGAVWPSMLLHWIVKGFSALRRKTLDQLKGFFQIDDKLNLIVYCRKHLLFNLFCADAVRTARARVLICRAYIVDVLLCLGRDRLADL